MGVVVVAVGWTFPLWLAMGTVATMSAALALRPIGVFLERTMAQRAAARRQRRAALLRESLTSRLGDEHRKELAKLETMVDCVRTRCEPGSGRSGPSLLDRLDSLLIVFVDRAIELRTVETALALSGPGSSDAFGPASQEGTDVRTTELARLRGQARARCGARLSVLRGELNQIGHVVRLAHEEVLAASLSEVEVSPALRDAIDEVALARYAWDEVEAELARAGA